MYPTGSCQKYSWSTADKNTLLKAVNFTTERSAVYKDTELEFSSYFFDLLEFLVKIDQGT